MSHQAAKGEFNSSNGSMERYNTVCDNGRGILTIRQVIKHMDVHVNRPLLRHLISDVQRSHRDLGLLTQCATGDGDSSFRSGARHQESLQVQA